MCARACAHVRASWCLWMLSLHVVGFQEMEDEDQCVCVCVCVRAICVPCHSGVRLGMLGLILPRSHPSSVSSFLDGIVGKTQQGEARSPGCIQNTCRLVQPPAPPPSSKLAPPAWFSLPLKPLYSAPSWIPQNSVPRGRNLEKRESQKLGVSFSF